MTVIAYQIIGYQNILIQYHGCLCICSWRLAPSAIMSFTIQDKLVLVPNEKWFGLPVPSQRWEMLENEIIFNIPLIKSSPHGVNISRQCESIARKCIILKDKKLGMILHISLAIAGYMCRHYMIVIVCNPKHIEPEKKWTTFHRYFQMEFFKWKCLDFD